MVALAPYPDRQGAGAVRQRAHVDGHHLRLRTAVAVEVDGGESRHLPMGAGHREQGQQAQKQVDADAHQSPLVFGYIPRRNAVAAREYRKKSFLSMEIVVFPKEIEYIELMNLADSPIIYLSKKLWQFSAGNRKRVVLYVSLFFLSNVVHFFRPLVIGHMLNTIQRFGISEQSFFQLMLSLALLLGIELGIWVFHGPARVIENTNAFFARKNFNEYLLKGTMDLPPAWHTDHHSGDTIDKINKATKGLYDFAGRGFELIQVIMLFVGSYGALIYFDVNASYIVLIMFVLTIGLITRYDKKLVKQWDQLYRFENKISAKIFDVISNITTVIILRVEQLVLTSIIQKMMQPFGLYKRNIRTNEWKWFFSNMLMVITTVLILFTYLRNQYVAGGVILVGTVYALYGYVERVSETFFRFAYLYNEIMQYKTSVKNADALSESFSQKSATTQVQLGKWKELSIQDLSFSYEGRKAVRKNLDTISLTIQHGQKIALIGDSGAGKSTFLKIMRALYSPQRGVIKVDGKTLPDGFNSISNEISLVPQDPEIFSTTIKENITIGVQHTQHTIERFVSMAQFSEVVARLPKKYESSVVEKGVNLSGGEKQRLALARGLLASEGKSIILFDEPTSSVDTKNELVIYKNIFTEYWDKTIISTIHRLHLLPLFDRVIIFQEGKVTADGSFQGLLEESEEFRTLWLTYTRAHSDQFSGEAS